MAVSANHKLGGCVIQLRLCLIDIVQKNYRGFQGYRPFHWTVPYQPHPVLGTHTFVLCTAGYHLASPYIKYIEQLEQIVDSNNLFCLFAVSQQN